jgi:hypothetical protein
MPYDKDKPYNNLPLLPPKHELETKAVLKKAISATAALAELRGVGNQIPNQSTAHVGSVLTFLHLKF